MSIETEIFKKVVVDFDQLKAYGFKKIKDQFVYKTKLMNNQFLVTVKVDERGKMTGALYDSETNEEYTLLRVEGDVPGYVMEVRNAYGALLKQIKEMCCHQLYFATKQANRIAKAIQNDFGDAPDFPWDKWSGYGVFRNPNNDKWYALIANVDLNKLDKKQKGEVEIINLKIDENKIPSLIKRSGFYPAYHMNKKTWLTIVLDETVPDTEIMQLVGESHAFTEKRKK